MTNVVNAHGCLLLLKAPLIEGMEVEVTNADTQEVRRGRVAWYGGLAEDFRNKLAIELDHPDPNFWGQRYTDFLLQGVVQQR
ncbi:hypothetical protein MYX77_04540 [Acidobacteriia bacterium AH_259_A11_L15]|nr:hypothetical protein [Acidobacteriia bacterium AH_259_A11_L15]